MYLADYHTHSDCSPDGRETIARMAEAAVARGLDEICITDHVDTICWGSRQPRWDFDWGKAQTELAEARRLYGDRLTIRLGAELGEAPMAFDRAEHLLDHAPKLDFVIGSVHMAGKKFGNFDLYYVEKNSETYYHALIDSYLEDVLELAKWGRCSVLGRRYGGDEIRARIAALLHDCTKKLDMPEQLALCAQYGIELDELEQKALKLLHSKTGAAIARDVFGVEDAVYDAIWYHTTGKPDMTLLEKIIYLADYIEPSRDFDGVDTLRQAVYEDLDHGLLMGLSMTIQEMEEMGNPVHHLTRDARDYLLKRGIR